MKFSFGALLIGCLSRTKTAVEGRTVHPNDDIYYHSKKIIGPSVWHFSADGLMVFSPQGDVIKNPSKAETCPVYETFNSRTNETETVDSCQFFILASDGHRYVWAGARSHTGDRIEMFDIDTAEFVGYANSCRVPMDMGFHPGRREMYVHCHNNQMDVLSSQAIGSNYSMIDLEYSTGFPAGRMLTHSSLGDTAYAAANNHPFLNEVDLSSRQVRAQHPLPLTQGGRNLAYSSVNRHVYVRPRVCCTCGSASADTPSCGRGSPEPVNIVTGPSQGTNVDGVCGSSCEGSAADTIGVHEFDSVSKTIVGSINIDPANGFGAVPVSSPDGMFVLLLGNDGGKAVRVLLAGSNGEKSTVVKDIPVDFKGGLPGQIVVSDFAFVTDDSRNILVLGASTDNNLVLVDMRDNSFRMRKLALTSDAESTGGNDRRIEWVAGTNYVWVSGGEAEELYIVELPTSSINSAKVAKTITGVPDGDIIFVENYERRVAMDMLKATTTAGTFEAGFNDDDYEQDNTLSIVAVVLAALALLVSSMSILSKHNKSSRPLFGAANASPGVKISEKPSPGVKISKKPDEIMETKSLGSKMVA